jgi:hypothetical protein
VDKENILVDGLELVFPFEPPMRARLDEDITDQAPPPPLGPVTRARAWELNYVIMLKNDGPED